MKNNILIIFICSLFLFGCQDKELTQRILETEGYTNIEFTGWSPLRCSDSFYATGFKANKSSKEIEGTVCSNLLFVDAVIRYR